MDLLSACICSKSSRMGTGGTSQRPIATTRASPSESDTIANGHRHHGLRRPFLGGWVRFRALDAPLRLRAIPAPKARARVRPGRETNGPIPRDRYALGAPIEQGDGTRRARCPPTRHKLQLHDGVAHTQSLQAVWFWR